MKLEPMLQRELDRLPVPYAFEHGKRHIFLIVEGQPKMIIASLGAKTLRRTLTYCAVRLRRLRERLENQTGANP